MRKGFDESVARRRVEFLIGEARSGNPCGDQTVSMAMRVISNFYSCGGDVSSSEAKKRCARISRKALTLREAGGNWIKETINEHQEELADVWKWILANRDSIKAEEVIDRFKTWPMVTVTKVEDQKLRDEKKRRGKNAGRTPLERYIDAGIEVLSNESGQWKEVGV